MIGKFINQNVFKKKIIDGTGLKNYIISFSLSFKIKK